MDSDLIKKLLPHEYTEYLIRNEVRSDGRTLDQHRPISIKRNVVTSHSRDEQRRIVSNVL